MIELILLTSIATTTLRTMPPRPPVTAASRITRVKREQALAVIFGSVQVGKLVGVAVEGDREHGYISNYQQTIGT